MARRASSLSILLILFSSVAAGAAPGAEALSRQPASDSDYAECSEENTKGDFCSCRVKDLRPTQIAVGMLAVQEKQEKIDSKSEKKLRKYLEDHPEPTVIGPEGELYIIDHHHLARALYESEIKWTYCTIVANYSDLSTAEFWTEMNKKRWIYPYDENGRGPQPVSSLPRTVSALKDDPYRSLAYSVREEGGYEKTDEPFAEFQWADFFRKRIKKYEIRADYDRALKKAMKLARSSEAEDLPGYIGSLP